MTRAHHAWAPRVQIDGPEMRVVARDPIAVRPFARRRSIAGFFARPLVRDVLAPVLATRVALIAIAYWTFRLPLDPAQDLTPNHLLSALARWDGVWYFHIAADGYAYHDAQFSAHAFSPLLPMLMRALAPLFGAGTDGILTAGAVVVNVAFVAACVLLWRLASLDNDADIARRAPLYLAVFPTSFFLSAIYPEAIFLALVLAAFLCARKGLWVWAGLLAALCVLARPHGVLVALPLAVEYLDQRRFSLRALRLDVLALALPFVAFAGWLAYQQVAFGDALAFVHAQAAWERAPGAPWQAFLAYLGPMRPSYSDLFFTLLFAALAVVVASTQRKSYAVFALLFVLVPLSTGQVYSMMRFGLAIFPVFIALAAFGRKPLFDRVYVPVGLMLGGAFAAFFVSQLFFFA